MSTRAHSPQTAQSYRKARTLSVAINNLLVNNH